jgi:hypothetical protein
MKRKKSPPGIESRLLSPPPHQVSSNSDCSIENKHCALLVQEIYENKFKTGAEKRRGNAHHSVSLLSIPPVHFPVFKDREKSRKFYSLETDKDSK